MRTLRRLCTILAVVGALLATTAVAADAGTRRPPPGDLQPAPGTPLEPVAVGDRTVPGPGKFGDYDVGLKHCLKNRVVVASGVWGDCTFAVQTFLRYDVNGQGWGPICPDTPNFGLVQVDGFFTSGTALAIRCFEEFNGLPQDGVVTAADYQRMLWTCQNDDTYILSEQGASRFGQLWFCRN